MHADVAVAETADEAKLPGLAARDIAADEHAADVAVHGRRVAVTVDPRPGSKGPSPHGATAVVADAIAAQPVEHRLSDEAAVFERRRVARGVDFAGDLVERRPRDIERRQVDQRRKQGAVANVRAAPGGGLIGRFAGGREAVRLLHIQIGVRCVIVGDDVDERRHVGVAGQGERPADSVLRG